MNGLNSMRRALALGAVLLLASAAGAQTPASADAKPAAQAVAKSAKKPTAPAFKLVLEPRAMDLLKATSARLAAAKTMSFTATIGYEYPSRLGPPLVYMTRHDVTMQRPDKLRVITPGDGPASEFFFDGKVMLAFAPTENLVAVADAPPTIDAALKQAFDKAAIYFPFTDLVAADPFAALTGGARLAYVMGQSRLVGGVTTDIVVWANDDVHLQMWIGSEDKLPRRIRAVFKADPKWMRHEMELTNWQIDPVLAADAFTSLKAQAAPRMAFAHPAAPPQGVKPLASKPRPAKAAPGKSASSPQ